MIIFAITRDGYLELEPTIKSAQYPVWVGKGVLDHSDIDQLRATGVNLTDFNYEIALTDQEAIEDALGEIALHHLGERVWLECQPKI